MCCFASVVQWIERQIPVLKVGGSSPFGRARKTLKRFVFTNFFGVFRFMSRKCPEARPGGSSHHIIHNLSQPSQIVAQHMTVDVQSGGYITVSQPALNIFCITAAFAKGIDCGVTKIVESNGGEIILFENLWKMTGHITGIDRFSVRAGANITAV